MVGLFSFHKTTEQGIGIILGMNIFYKLESDKDYFLSRTNWKWGVKGGNKHIGTLPNGIKCELYRRATVLVPFDMYRLIYIFPMCIYFYLSRLTVLHYANANDGYSSPANAVLNAAMSRVALPGIVAPYGM